MIELEKIEKAKERLSGIVHTTPFSYAPNLSKFCENNIYLKKENLQITGSFKLRGAFNKIASLSEDERSLGVVAASAGNHAGGVAFSAEYFGIDATIFMPEATPLTKVNGVKSYGAEVKLKGSNYDEAYDEAIKYAKAKNLTFVHPFNDDEVIAGQGSVALELLKQSKDLNVELDAIVVPIGGGGLISGIASVLKAQKELYPNIKIIGVTSAGAPAMNLSFKAKKPINSESVKTIADGIAVKNTDNHTLDLILDMVDEIVEVEDKEIANAILFLVEKQKLVVEGAGAVGVAAMMHNKIDIKDKNIAILLSGGNIDVTMLSLIIEKGLIKSHRKLNLTVTLIDKPGSLRMLTDIFTELEANIVQIGYDRNSALLDFGDANVSISLETKGKEHQQMIKEAMQKYGYRFVEQM
jgi:threonine dehydratase